MSGRPKDGSFLKKVRSIRMDDDTWSLASKIADDYKISLGKYITKLIKEDQERIRVAKQEEDFKKRIINKKKNSGTPVDIGNYDHIDLSDIPDFI